MLYYFDYLFTDNETGEEFFVEIAMPERDFPNRHIDEAREIAEEYFENATFNGDIFTDAEAEVWGLDTY